MLTLISFLFVLAVLITVHEWGHYRMAAAVGVRVIRFSVGFGKPLFTWTPKRQPKLDGVAQQTEFVIAVLPFGGYVKMLDEREEGAKPQSEHEAQYAFNRKPLWARSLVVLAGPVANLVLAVALFALVNWIGQEVPQARINKVIEGGAAQAAGLLAQDVVLSVNGKTIKGSGELMESIRFSTSSQVQRWEIDRGGKTLVLDVTPKVIEEDHAVVGRNKVGRIGVQLNTHEHLERVQYGPIDGVLQGVVQTWRISALTLKTLGQIVVGEASVRNLSGPITVAEYSGKTAQYGLVPFLLFMALVSVGLGVLNLLPLPMLDGGHLMYHLWELITGKPVSDWWLDKLQRAGFALIILLSVLAIYNDVVRLTGLQSLFQ